MILTIDAHHVYRVDRRVVPSVSSLLRAAGRGVDYAAVPPHVLEQARNRGLHVHTACEYHDLDGDLDWDSVVPRWKGYVEAWVAWKQEHQPAYLFPEVKVYHPDLDYAGTLDVQCILGGFGAVIDRKTSASIHADNYALQLAAYTMPSLLFAGADGILCTGPAPKRRIVVQLQKTGRYVMQECTDHHDYEDWRAVVRLARRTERYARDGGGESLLATPTRPPHAPLRSAPLEGTPDE